MALEINSAVEIHSGGTQGSGGILVSSAAVMTGAVIDSRYDMRVGDDGFASDTTVNQGGAMYVSGTGAAENTKINYMASMYVHSGGKAVSTTIANMGIVHLSGGTLVSNYVSNGGFLVVSRGGLAVSTDIAPQGIIRLVSGGVASNAVVAGAGKDDNSGETAGGSMYVGYYGAGAAENVYVSSGGGIHVYQGGTISKVTVAAGGMVNHGIRLIEGNYYDSALHISHAVLETSGYIYNGQTIEQLDIGATSRAVLKVFSGAVVSRVTVMCHGSMNIGNSLGGIAYDTMISSDGRVTVTRGGSLTDTTVLAGGTVQLSSGAVHRGKLDITSGAAVSVISGGKVDFTLTGRTADDSYLVNDMSLISGAPQYTITVAADQALGIYRLAQGAENFTGSVTVGDGTTDFGVLNVNGDVLVGNGFRFALLKSDGDLTLSIRNGVPPTAPTAFADVTDWINGDVHVTAVFDPVSVLNEFSLDGGTVWQSYTAPVTFADNGAVAFRSTDADDNVSSETVYAVENIDKIFPEIAITADDTAPYAEKVNVSAEITDAHLAAAEYSTDGENWYPCVAGGVMFTANGTAYFRGVDSAGNLTASGYEVTNIANAPVKICSSGVLTSRGAAVDGCVLSGGGNDAMIVSGGTARNVAIGSGGSALVSGGGILESAEVAYGGALTLDDDTVLRADQLFAGEIGVNAGENTCDMHGAAIVLDVAGRVTADGAIVTGRFSSFFTGAKYAVNFADTQGIGSYLLAEDAAGFTATVDLRINGQNTRKSLTIGREKVYDAKTFSLTVEDDRLIANVSAGSGPTARCDFNETGISDIVAFDPASRTVDVLMDQPDGSWAGVRVGGMVPDESWEFRGTAYIDADNVQDVIWVHNVTGEVGVWLVDGDSFVHQTVAGATEDWHFLGAADVTGDGRDNLLWQHDGGTVLAWASGLNGAMSGNIFLGGVNPDEWTFCGTGDFTGDGRSDVLWRNNDSDLVGFWDSADGSWVSLAGAGSDWTIVGTGDFTGDGIDEVLWQNDSGLVGAWDVSGDGVEWCAFGTTDGLGPGYGFSAVGDFDGDGTEDVLWAGAGDHKAWLMADNRIKSTITIA